MNIYESAEDYLERILIIQHEKGFVRSIDIAHELNFSKPSVSVAMKKLRENDYIKVDDSGYITLTDAGYKIASTILERHEVLTTLLKQLGVSDEVAAQDACKIEHDLSDETFACIKKHYQEHVIKK